MSWLVYALATAGTLAAHNITYKFASQHFHAVWAAFLYVPLMFLFLVPFAAHLYLSDERPAITVQGTAVLAALAATGAAFVVLYLKTFQQAPEASMVVAVVNVGAIIVSVSLAAWLFGETLTLNRMAGIALAATGIILALKG